MDGTTSSQEESVNDLDENSSVSTIQSSSRELCPSVEIENEEQGRIDKIKNRLLVSLDKLNLKKKQMKTVWSKR